MFAPHCGGGAFRDRKVKKSFVHAGHASKPSGETCYVVTKERFGAMDWRAAQDIKDYHCEYPHSKEKADARGAVRQA
jgi:hypothetical protein